MRPLAHCINLRSAWGGGLVVSTILRSLREGYEPAPFFDRHSGPAYVITGSAAATGAILFALRGLSFDPRLALPIAWAGMALVSGWLARRANFPKIATALESTALVYGQAFAFMFVIYALMTFNVPLADRQLAAADHGLSFYWPDLAEPFRHSAALLGALKIVYMSFNWEPAFVTICLSAAGLSLRSWSFVAAAAGSLAVASIIGCLVLPADGAAVYYHIRPWPELAGLWSQSHVIHWLRSGRHYIDESMITGLISFPSYHGCSAVLYVWAIWPLRYLRWPVVLLNVGMTFTAIVGGEHYLIDIIGGVILGWIAVRLTSCYVGQPNSV